MNTGYRSVVSTTSFLAFAALSWPGDAVRAQAETSAGMFEEIIGRFTYRF